jgi:hypothetical protein
MPGYSPEPNPDELLDADLKRNVNASRAHNLDRGLATIVDTAQPGEEPSPTSTGDAFEQVLRGERE